MIIATFNVNSLKTRLDIVLNWIKANNPDFLFLQEIKGENEEIFENFISIGYNPYFLLQKTYNGVAILSKHNCAIVNKNLPNFEDAQARLITVKHNNVYYINAYMPNGNPIKEIDGSLHEKYLYKLNWLNAFYDYIKNLINQKKQLVIGADFNIIPLDIDCYNPKEFINDALAQKEVRDIYFKLLSLNLIDCVKHFNPNNNNIFTWWDYRNTGFARDNGVRIDHILLTPTLADKLENAYIDKQPRMLDKPSDHTPVVIKLHN
jgi:exodeoxyribonuclease-3